MPSIRLLLPLTCATLAVTACAHERPLEAAAPPEGEGPRLTLQVPGGAFEIQATPEALLGPDVQVSHKGGEDFRGTAFHHTVDLTVRDNKVTGLSGGLPVNLFLTPEAGSLTIRGMYAGNLGTLEINPKGINGSLGNCGYSLRTAPDSSGTTYQGERSCKGSPESVSLTLPPGALENPSPRLAVALALLLGA